MEQWNTGILDLFCIALKELEDFTPIGLRPVGRLQFLARA
jgi:hypothetical protein